MPLENLTGSNVFITNLVPSNPAGTDPVSEGDNHIAGTKNVLLNSFPAINGAVTATPTQLNQLAPVSGAAFTGVPTAPTAAPGTSTTQLATTEFVTAGITAIPAPPSVGVGQTWQNVIGSRAVNTNYTNLTGKPIFVACSVAGGSGADNIYLYVDGVTVGYLPNISDPGGVQLTAIVPNGSYYQLADSGAGSLSTWAELR